MKNLGRFEIFSLYHPSSPVDVSPKTIWLLIWTLAGWRPHFAPPMLPLFYRTPRRFSDSSWVNHTIRRHSLIGADRWRFLDPGCCGGIKFYLSKPHRQPGRLFRAEFIWGGRVRQNSINELPTGRVIIAECIAPYRYMHSTKE